MHNNVRLFQLKILRQFASQLEHPLVRGPYRYATGSIDVDETRMRLDITLMNHVRLIRILKNIIRLRKSSLDVAFALLHQGLHVSEFRRFRPRPFVTRIIGMDDRSVRLHCL